MRNFLIALGFLLFALCALETADAVRPDDGSSVASPSVFQQTTSETTRREPTLPVYGDPTPNESLLKRFYKRLKRFYAESRRRIDLWRQRRRSSRGGIRESIANACRCVKNTVDRMGEAYEYIKKLCE